MIIEEFKEGTEIDILPNSKPYGTNCSLTRHSGKTFTCGGWSELPEHLPGYVKFTLKDGPSGNSRYMYLYPLDSLEVVGGGVPKFMGVKN